MNITHHRISQLISPAQGYSWILAEPKTKQFNAYYVSVYGLLDNNLMWMKWLQVSFWAFIYFGPWTAGSF